jgi:hypothetical protein
MATVVTVIPPFQVSHDGTVYGPGEKAEVPDEMAEHWLALGYVSTPKPPRKKSSPPESVPDGG